MAQYKSEIESSTKTEDTGPTEAEIATQERLVRAAEKAHEAGHYIRARRYLEAAAKIVPLEPTEADLLAEANLRLEELEPLIEQYERGQYTRAVPDLWRLREDDPDDPNVRLLLVDSYYNLAVEDLQKGLPGEALAKLEQIEEVAPESEEFQRLRLFAETYSRRGEDILYRVYVKYLPSRS